MAGYLALGAAGITEESHVIASANSCGGVHQRNVRAHNKATPLFTTLQRTLSLTECAKRGYMVSFT